MQFVLLAGRSRFIRGLSWHNESGSDEACAGTWSREIGSTHERKAGMPATRR